MLEERDSLHQWEKKQIVVKQKEETIAQYVNETILTLRWYLVHKIINDTKNLVSSNIEDDNTEILLSIKDYLGLTKVIAKNLGRVLARF
jgi:DNA primase